jgi:DNA-binding phage protein
MVKLSPLDVADYLTTEKHILFFLEESFKEGDTADQLSALKVAERALHRIQEKHAARKQRAAIKKAEMIRSEHLTT